MAKVKLKNIANIQTGFSFRSKIIRDTKGNVSVIQMKNLTDGVIDLKNLDKTQITEINHNQILRKGDLILKTRGLGTKAFLLNEQAYNVILAAPLLRIRIKRPDILPEYLLWYLNLNKAQAFFKRRAKGTFQKMVTKQVLEELEIEIPPIEKQRKIVEISQLAQKELALMNLLAKKKEQYLTKVLLNNIEGE